MERTKQKHTGFEYYLKQVRLQKEGKGRTFDEYMKELERRGENPGFEYYLHRAREVLKT